MKYEMYNGGIIPIPKGADREWHIGLLRALGIKEDVIKKAMNGEKSNDKEEKVG